MKMPLDDPYWKMYTIVIQLGAILALCLLFLGRIVEFRPHLSQGRKRRPQLAESSHLADLDRLCCTSVPALLLHKWSEKNLGSLKAMALALLLGGIVMWVIDAWSVAPRGSHPRRGSR